MTVDVERVREEIRRELDQHAASQERVKPSERTTLVFSERRVRLLCDELDRTRKQLREAREDAAQVLRATLLLLDAGYKTDDFRAFKALWNDKLLPGLWALETKDGPDALLAPQPLADADRERFS